MCKFRQNIYALLGAEFGVDTLHLPKKGGLYFNDYVYLLDNLEHCLYRVSRKVESKVIGLTEEAEIMFVRNLSKMWFRVFNSIQQ